MSPALTIQRESTEEAAVELAVETLYRFLAAVFSEPSDPRRTLLTDRASHEAALAAADVLREEFADCAVPLALGELPGENLDVSGLLGELDRPGEELAAEHTRVFGLVSSRECPPYEMEYHAIDDTFFRSQQMADVAGFYRAFGLSPSDAAGERPDHLALELEFAAFLLMKKRLATVSGSDAEAAERAAVCQQARTAFFRDHFGWWTPSFALILRRKSERGLYFSAAHALAALLPIERALLGVPPPAVPVEDPASRERSQECEGCPLQS